MSRVLGEAKTLKICDTCPWVKANQGKPHKDGWYTAKNIRRLWAGLRTGNAPGMICHSTDPGNKDYGGDANIKPGHEAECGGAVHLVIQCVNAFSKQQPQPVSPPMTKRAMAWWVGQVLFGLAPTVETKFTPAEIGIAEHDKKV